MKNSVRSIISHIKTIEKEKSRLEKSFFWKRFFSSKIGRGMDADMTPIIFCVGSMGILMTTVSINITWGILNASMAFMSFGSITALGFFMAFIGYKHGKYVKPNHSSIARCLDNLKNVFEFENMDISYLENLIDNVDNLSIDWWERLGGEMIKYNEMKNRMQDIDKIESIKSLVRGGNPDCDNELFLNIGAKKNSRENIKTNPG